MHFSLNINIDFYSAAERLQEVGSDTEGGSGERSANLAGGTSVWGGAGRWHGAGARGRARWHRAGRARSRAARWHGAAHGAVGRLGLDDGSVRRAGRVGGERAVISNADGLELWLSGLGDGHWWLALVSEGIHQSLADGLDVRLGNTEAGGGHADLLDEVADLSVVEGHVLVDLVHVGGAGVWRGGHAVLRAAEQVREVLVQVGEELAERESVKVAKTHSGRLDILLVGAHVVGGGVVHERSGTTTVEEVDGGTHAAASVGGGEHAVEVWGEVDALVLASSWSEDTGDLDADVWLGVVTNDGSVDDEGQESLLVHGGVILEQGGGVLVADGHVLGSSARCEGHNVGDLHVD